jgi:hypothetical protein
MAVWGDSFAPANPATFRPAVPLDAADVPLIAEPGGAMLALLAGVFENDLQAIYTRHGLASESLLDSPYLYVPHDAILPGMLSSGGAALLKGFAGHRHVRTEEGTTAHNVIHRAGLAPQKNRIDWMIQQLTGPANDKK